MATSTPQRRLLSVADCAAYLGRTEGAVRKLVYRREIPFVKIGRTLQFDLYELERWIRLHSEDADS